MMDQVVQPCMMTNPNVMMVHIITSAFTTILVAFLTHRRVRKDRVDDERWTMLNGGRPPNAKDRSNVRSGHKGEH